MIKRLLAPYGLIAGLCVLIHLGILLAGEVLGVHFTISITISFMACLAIGYLLHSRYTFRKKISQSSFFTYTLVNSLNYPLSILTIWIFHELLRQPMIIAAPASTLALTLYNFFSSRWAISSSAVETKKQEGIRERS